MKQLPLSIIKLNPNNPRVIKDAAFVRLVESLREAPWMLDLRPIVVDANLVILGGNMRFKAALEAGLTSIPVLCAEELTAEQKQEFIIKDNLSYGEWDYDLLAADWDVDKLTEWGLELPTIVDVNTCDEDKLFEESSCASTDIVSGDIFKVGKHIIACGDSFDSEFLSRVFEIKNPDFLFIDPMYDAETREIINLFHAFDFNHFLIMATMRQCAEFIERSQLKFRFDLVLNQKIPSSTLNKKVPYYLHKNVIYLTKTDETIFNCDYAKGEFSEKGYYPSVIEAAKQTQDAHGLAKNVEGIKKMLSGFKFKIVCDFFAGGGSTMVAAHALKRQSISMDNKPLNCQIMLDRIINLDGSLDIRKL